MTPAPISIRAANAFVSLHHRHNRPTQGGLFAIAVEHGGAIVGVAIVGRPLSRHLQDGRTVEVTRLVVVPEAPRGTCSWLYGRCRRVAGVLGYRKVITYTLTSESGASLRGVGWKPTAASAPKQWRHTDPGQRSDQPVCDQQKIRWEAAV